MPNDLPRPKRILSLGAQRLLGWSPTLLRITRLLGWATLTQAPKILDQILNQTNQLAQPFQRLMKPCQP